MQDLCAIVNGGDFMFEMERQEEGSVIVGAILAIGLYLLQAFIILYASDNASVSEVRFFQILAYVPPLSQFLYIVPLFIERRNRGRSSTSNGLLGGAVVMGGIHFGIFGFLWR
jgi:hypothetical protein